jgi:8-oxo-dGTP pyrophosphatase MutT (NUDIX family)
VRATRIVVANPTAASNDGATVCYPVSVKGVVLHERDVVLVKNRRNEWELPGGKLEPGESLEGCVAREIAEVLGLSVRVGPVVDVWIYAVSPDLDVLIVTYGCETTAWPATLASPEGAELGVFPLDVLDGLPLPAGYRTSIRRWAAAR